MITFCSMSEKRYCEFRKNTLTQYAKEKVTAGDCVMEEAEALAESAFRRFSPQEQCTPGVFFYDIHHEKYGVVGYVFFHIVQKTKWKEMFLIDIWIEKPFRGKGIGKETMNQLERHAFDYGVHKIGLHVFANNERAFQLYKSVGYKVTDYTMYKKLIHCSE